MSTEGSPTVQPAKKAGKAGWIAGIVIATIAGCTIGATVGGSTDSEKSEAATSTVTVTETPAAETVEAVAETVTVTAEPEGPAAAFGEGVKIVGSQIQPGTYSSEGGSRCYWKRMSGASGEGSDIIANNFGGGEQVVTIDASDFAFDSRNCGEWSLVS